MYAQETFGWVRFAIRPTRAYNRQSARDSLHATHIMYANDMEAGTDSSTSVLLGECELRVVVHFTWKYSPPCESRESRGVVVTPANVRHTPRW